MAYNNNFSNFNGNPCSTPTSFSDVTNPAYHNFNNLVYKIGLIWINTCPSLNTKNKTGIIITTLHRVNGGYNSPESYCQPSYQHLASYTPSPEQPLEESIDGKKRMEALDEFEWRIQILEDSKSR